MRSSNQFVIAVLITISLALTSSAEDWWKINGQPQADNFVRGKYFGKKSAATEELKVFLLRSDFEEWVTYEDELVKLKYPKHPLLKFEKKKPGDEIKVEGGVTSTADNRFQQAYYLTAGDATYGVFLVQQADWLDDGVCFCGPMVHHVYNFENDCLVRFSLLPGGTVKKAQVLGDDVRLMAFEWTHLACPRTVYETMVESMELKVPLEVPFEQVAEEVTRRYGIEGRAGLMQRGMSADQAIILMGEPAERTEEQISWQGTQGDYRMKAVVKLKEGKIVQLVDESVTRISDEPIEGTLSWARYRVPEDRPSFGPEPDKEKELEVSDETKDKAMEICIRSLSGPRAWEANQIIQTLAEQYDYYSPKVAKFFVAGDRMFDNWEFNSFDLYRRKQAISKDQAKQYVREMLDDLAATDPYTLKPDRNSWISPVDRCHRLFMDALNLQRVLDPAEAEKTVVRFANNDQLGYRVPVLENLLDEFPDRQQFQILHSSLVEGSKREDPHMIDAALSAIVLKTWSDANHKETLREAIEQLESDPNDSDWLELRERALASLK